MAAGNGDTKENNYHAGIWTCFACTLPNEWQASKCAGCGKSWKHKTSWTTWTKNRKQQHKPWALAEPSHPSPPWRKWDNGPPGGLTKTPGGQPVFATGGGHGGDGDEAARAGEIEKVSKALEACAPLLGPKHEAVLGLQKQLEELNSAKPKATPIHVEVGKFQKKLKQVEQKLVRLSQKLSDAALAILDKQNEIIETDDEIKKTKKEFQELHHKLASIGRRQDTVVPTIDELGMQDASPELKRRAALLLRRLCHIVAEADENAADEEETAAVAEAVTTEEEAGTKLEVPPGEDLAEKVGKAIQVANAVLSDLPQGVGPRGVQPPAVLATDCKPTQLPTGDSQSSTFPAGQPTPGTQGFDSSQAAAMDDEKEGDAFDDIELYEEDLEAEAAAAEAKAAKEEGGEYKEAPTRKRRATASSRLAAAAQSSGEAGAAEVALSLSEAIVQAAIANGRAGLSRG